MKKLYYDEETGKVIGWYDINMHSNIPEPNIDINDEVWQNAINNNYNFIDLETGNLSKKDFRTTEQIIVDKSKTILNKTLIYLDEEAVKLGFTGDDKTRPYRAISNYVGYDNRYRESAERLGKWISEVFAKIEAYNEDDINTIDTDNFKDLLPDINDF